MPFVDQQEVRVALDRDGLGLAVIQVRSEFAHALMVYRRRNDQPRSGHGINQRRCAAFRDAQFEIDRRGYQDLTVQLA